MLHEKQIEAYRRMSPNEKWAQARGLILGARRRKADFLRQQHPDWSDQEIAEEVKRIFLYARS